jgi:hypothetical protein
MMADGEFKKCARPECDRLVRPCVLWCCQSCCDGRLREGMKPGHKEITHSQDCWRRHEERMMGPQLRQAREEGK